MRALAGTILLAVGLSVLDLPITSSATGVTCEGRPATMVGGPGGSVVGTPGDDVIVTAGAVEVTAGDGDDVVCVTGSADEVRADLGGGDDTYVGGPGVDQVFASDPWSVPRSLGIDRVSTGGGADLVATGGAPGDPDHDTIDLGPGNDVAWIEGAVDPSLPVAGGAGRDRLELDRDSMRGGLALDNAIGRGTDGAGRVVMAWNGMESFRLTPFPRPAPVSFAGGSGDETVVSYIPLSSVLLGAGDDRLDLEVQDGPLVDRATYDGGPGTDAIAVYAGAGDSARRVSLDVPRQRLLFAREAPAVHAHIRRLESYRLSARRLDVRGSGGADRFDVLGCRGTVAGGGGDDRIRIISIDDVACGYLSQHARLVVRGGPGDDTLLGSFGRDILLGGPGHDVARGHGGRDRCVAEVTGTCED